MHSILSAHLFAHPILTCAEAGAFEAAFFAGDEEREWRAMQQAGVAVAEGVLRDFEEIGGFVVDPDSAPAARVLVLAGKGHNAGDALLAAALLAGRHPTVTVEVVFALGGASGRGGEGALPNIEHPTSNIQHPMLESGGGKLGEEGLRPLAARAWAKLRAAAGERVRVRRALECGAGVPPAWSGGVPAAGRDDSPARSEATTGRAGARPAAGTPPLHIYDLVIDGVFGFQFRPPLSPELARVLAWANALPARLRAAVDLPSGLGEAGAFRADFTYATGIVKEPLVASGGLPNAGRLRYLNLGFFDEGEGGGGEEVSENAPASARRPAKWVLTPAALAPLRELRAADSDKRTYGHVFLAGGSRSYPGAIFMAASAAVRSGAGLVTVFAPESLVAAFAARLPEAMWVACPETPEGGLALEGLHLVQERIGRATALVVGPGLGRERESLVLAEEMVKMSSAPVVIDADALQPQIVSAGTIPRILTPHAGELARIAERVPSSAVLVRKGPVTCIEAQGVSFYSFKGGPVLARGGSGDLLAGLMGGLLAQSPGDPAAAACRAVAWHGAAADALARAHGAVAVRTTQLLDFLAVALRAEH